MPVNGIPIVVVYAGQNLIIMLMVTDGQNVHPRVAVGQHIVFRYVKKGKNSFVERRAKTLINALRLVITDTTHRVRRGQGIHHHAGK